MTAKQAIKARCRDCSGHVCGFDDCVLKGLAGNASGTRRATAIRKYCQWCMNGNPVNQCASPDCAIYRYRAGTIDTALKMAFLPLKTPIVQGIKVSESKDVNSYGKPGEASKTPSVPAPERA